MVGRLELDRREVAAGGMEALVVPPCHPGRGRELDLVDRPPGSLRPDELGLVEAVDALGEGVVVAVAPDPTEVTAPSSARRSVYLIARY
jgi:hypothetical protein